MVLGGSLAVSACAVGPGPESGYAPGAYAPEGVAGPEPLGARVPAAAAGPAQPVAILLPLTGPFASVGQPMLQAARLALEVPGAPPLLVQDTGGSPQGAAGAVRGALAGGARLILGPLTAPETVAAAPAAQSAGVPMLAFTNDPVVAKPGVWVMGITPEQQVARLVGAAAAAGKTRFAALLPETPLGQALAHGLAEATAAAGVGTPTIRFHGAGMASITSTTRSLSDYAGRWGPIEAQIRAARAAGTLAGRRQAAALGRSVPPPPPFDVLLLGDTGVALHEVASILAYYVVGPPSVQIVGLSLWADPASDSGRLPGAWYAAPEPSARAGFVQAFSARYGAAPPGVADLAFDAAELARVLAGGGYGVDALTAPRGFAGADGWFVLQPDGRVRRGLAVFAVGRGGAREIASPPAPGARIGA